MRRQLPQLIRHCFLGQDVPKVYNTIFKGIHPSVSFNKCYKLLDNQSKFVGFTAKEFKTYIKLDSGGTSKTRVILGKTKGVTATGLRGDIYDESQNVSENLSALESASLDAEASESLYDDTYQIYPDETTGDRLFNGIK